MKVDCTPPATPASSTGVLPTIASVEATTTSPIPMPSPTIGGHSSRYEDSACSASSANIDPDTTIRPSVIGTRGPNRPVSHPENGLLTTKNTVSGSVRIPR